MYLILALFLNFLHRSRGDGVIRMEPRIILGNKSLPGQFPYMISIQLDGAHHCGGTIIDKLWSLSAAHCFHNDKGELYEVSSLRIAAGSIRTNLGDIYNINNIFINDFYNRDKLINDIALIQLENPYEFSSVIKNIPVNSEKVDDDEENLPVTIIGWGYTSDYAAGNDILPAQQYHVNVQTIPKEVCMQIFSDITLNTICVFDKEGKSSCIGDSGGPLVYQGQQIGVLSYGEEKCVTKNPEVYTRVSSYYDWIIDTISDNRRSK